MYIPPPYPPLHDVIDVDETVNESLLPIFPFTHVPFPDEYDIRENVHPLMLMVVVELDPPLTFTIDVLTFASLDVDADVTVIEDNVSDPCEI